MTTRNGEDRLPSPERVERNLIRIQGYVSSIDEVARRLVEAYEEAYEAGLGAAGGRGVIATGGRGGDSDPTGETVVSWDHQTLRYAVASAARSLRKADDLLARADDRIRDAFFDIDPDLRAIRAEMRAFRSTSSG